MGDLDSCSPDTDCLGRIDFEPAAMSSNILLNICFSFAVIVVMRSCEDRRLPRAGFRNWASCSSFRLNFSLKKLTRFSCAVSLAAGSSLRVTSSAIALRCEAAREVAELCVVVV